MVKVAYHINVYLRPFLLSLHPLNANAWGPNHLFLALGGANQEELFRRVHSGESNQEGPPKRVHFGGSTKGRCTRKGLPRRDFSPLPNHPLTANRSLY